MAKQSDRADKEEKRKNFVNFQHSVERAKLISSEKSDRRRLIVPNLISIGINFNSKIHFGWATVRSWQWREHLNQHWKIGAESFSVFFHKTFAALIKNGWDSSGRMDEENFLFSTISPAINIIPLLWAFCWKLKLKHVQCRRAKVDERRKDEEK